MPLTETSAALLVSFETAANEALVGTDLVKIAAALLRTCNQFRIRLEQAIQNDPTGSELEAEFLAIETRVKTQFAPSVLELVKLAIHDEKITAGSGKLDDHRCIQVAKSFIAGLPEGELADGLRQELELQMRFIDLFFGRTILDEEKKRETAWRDSYGSGDGGVCAAC